ncbi:MAG: nucleotidyltransferase family protein [Bacteroidales bacterium]
MKAMILAAGKGTRMRPLTDKMPKALLPVQGVALLEHTIRYLKYYGITEIIINVHHHAKQIIDFIEKNNSFGIRIEFSDETDELLDTGGGLYKARWFFDETEPFILTSSDVITDLDLNNLVGFHKKNKPLVSLAVKHRNSSRDFLFDQQYHLCGWHNNVNGETKLIREVANPVKIGFSTIHCISPSIFRLITERGCFSIVDSYLRLAVAHTIMGFEHDQSRWIECGRIENYPLLNEEPEIREIYNKYQD